MSTIKQNAEVKKSSNIKDIADSRSEIFNVDPHKLSIKEGWNCREINFDPANDEDLALANSIAEMGVLQPLTVYREGTEFFITDGHRRYFASLYAIETLKAELKNVPVRTEIKTSNEADRMLSMLVRNAGKPLSVIEQGNVFKRLIALGWKAVDIAKKASVTPARVSQILELQALPEAVKTMVNKGEVSANTATATWRATNGDSEATKEKLTEALKTAVADGRKKVLPKDVPEAQKVNVKEVIKEAFDASEVDYDSDDAFTIVKMPHAEWQKVRELLKL